MTQNIIRVPTRTKTNSFNGSQMDFKFPSKETLPNASLEECQLNNHYLLNDSLSSKHNSPSKQPHSSSSMSWKVNQSDINEEIDDFDSHSQILSDYSNPTTTNTNTNTNIATSTSSGFNSSNGYYSFANISDNTTNYLKKENTMTNSIVKYSTRSTTSMQNKHSNGYPTTLAPSKNDAIPESSKHNSTFSIPTADNISYRIISTSSSIQDSHSKIIPNEVSKDTITQLKSRSNHNHNPKSKSKYTHKNTSSTSTTRKTSKYKYTKEMGSIPNKNSSLSNRNSFISHIKDSKSPNLERVPTIESVSSMHLSSSASSIFSTKNQSRHRNHNQPKPHPNKKSSKSSLKRSNAIKCKGGLLYYFSLLGIKLKKLLKAIGMAFNFNRRSKHNSKSNLHGKNSKSNLINSSRRSASLNHNSKKLSLSLKKPTTSHLKRTQNYVTNLQKSISQKSLENVIESNDITPMTIDKSMQTSVSSISTISSSPELTPFEVPNEIVTKQPTNSKKITASSLRRTNSSIRRAASTLTDSTNIKNHNSIRTNTHTSIRSTSHSNSNFVSNEALTRNNSITSTPKQSNLVRSSPSIALNSIVRQPSIIARQPSIVVKNKVIPLTISRFSITEELNEDDDELNNYNYKNETSIAEESELENGNDEYIIDTNIMQQFDHSKSINKNNKDDVESFISNESEFIDANEYTKEVAKDDDFHSITSSNDYLHEEKAQEVDTETEEEEEEEEEAPQYTEEEKIKLREMYGQYLRNVIAQRIKIRLQLSKYQETGKISYLQAIDNFLTENETEYSSSQLFDNNESPQSSMPSELEDVEETDEEKLQKKQTPKISNSQMFSYQNYDNFSKSGSLKNKASVITFQTPFYSKENGNNTSVFSLPSSTSVQRSLTLPVGIKV
ncbi:hypothetical protein TBLA_0B03810 [Henningerozyma blattae CBS 6284]|uniref:Altered inheritance of mitochondria protein 44 n=1 Tax=Henningerozyma blattae (strain ATCC 34711 / CBS 6284 / DSM 70876 / NBRC 10599 / NRRL Y-10934 / UCD 77-7) TaxID=1071380 RepID=I2GYL8_HENB6|nr:hypothetical protein TBLA_0B03810 [Tetrapisispora blattae CBS 6284]CCH59220.1 hypothetical protein TBLA_0B03810 [Tetrapisispora blattae CBS 6284]